MDFKVIISENKPRPKISINISRLSRETGYSKSHLSRVFSRKVKPSVKCLMDLASTLGTTMDDLNSQMEKGRIDVIKID